MSRVIPFQDGMALGMGYKSLPETTALEQAVTVTAQRGTPSQRVKFEHFASRSLSSLASALDISASLAINASGFNVSGGGHYIKDKEVTEADLNFVVKVTVQNSYQRSAEEPKMVLVKAFDNAQDFYEIYGDSYVSEILEGGQFVGILSIKARDSSDIQQIQATLEGGFGGVQAKGAGAYNTKDLMKMASTHVSVAYSGANIPNADSKSWDMDRMFSVASKFESYVAQGKNAVSVVLKEYISVPDFVRLPNFSKLRMDKSDATKRTYAMLNDLGALDELKKSVETVMTEADKEEVELQASTTDGAYEANLKGLQAASSDIADAIAAIQYNASVMDKNPQAVDSSQSALKTYTSPNIIKFKLPHAKPARGNSGYPPSVGAAMSASTYFDGDKERAYIYWQDMARQITTAVFVDGSWAVEKKTVYSEAAANTPIASCCSKDGNQVSVFHLTSERCLTERTLSGGAWATGGLSDMLKAQPQENQAHTSTQLASIQLSNGQKWVFYQAASNLKLMWACYQADSKTWSLKTVQIKEGEAMVDVVPMIGTALGVAVISPASGTTTPESFMLAFQRPDLKPWTLVYDGEHDTWAPGQQPLGDKRIPLQSSMSLYGESNGHVGLALNNEDSNIVTLSWSKEKQTWSDATTVASSIKGGAITVASWSSGKRFLFTQLPQSLDINQFTYNEGKWSTPIVINKSR